MKKYATEQIGSVLVWFYGMSTILGYLMPNPFLYIKQFYVKQFRLT